MTELQEAFLDELKSKEKLTVPEYIELFNKYCDLAYEHEKNSSGNSHKAKVMSEYYMVSVLSKFVKKESIIDQVVRQRESSPRVI